MALTATTLAGAKNTNDTTITLTSATGAAKKMLALVDGEMMRITDVSLTPTLQVVPGYMGTTAGPHGILAPVAFGVPADFPGGPLGPQSASYGVNGAIAVPQADTIVFLTKATAGTYTIAAPNVGQQNTVTFISTTAAAHVVTMSGNPAATDVATFTAAIGSSFTVKAQGGVWDATGQNGVAIA